MLAPQSLWDSVESLHESLFEAVSTVLRSRAFAQTRHVLTLPPPQRGQGLAAINQDKSHISECRQRIRAAQRTLEELDTICASAENGLSMCAQPIGALPLELFQYIIDFMVESPRQWKRIVEISNISHTWRSAVCGMPRLFVSPNWTWSPDALETWISRAGACLLHVHIRLSDDEKSSDELDRMARAMVPHLYRVQTIRVEGQGYFVDEFPPSFTSIFREHFLPALESIIVSGRGPSDLCVRPDRAPKLHMLHSSEIPLRLNKGPLNLQSLGLLVLHVEDMERAFDAAKSQQIPFHLSIYAHPSIGLSESLHVGKHRIDSWTQVTSLRLYQFRGGDQVYVGTLVSQLEMPNLAYLELVDFSYDVFAEIANEFPVVTNRCIQKLLIACRDEKPENNFILPLNEVKHEIGDQALPSIPFPNLQSFALRDTHPNKPCEWSIDFGVIEALVESRRGILKKLILPCAFRPQLPVIEGDSSTRTAQRQALTVGEESKLKAAGDLSEIAYDFTMNTHGLPESYPRFSVA
ncbi:hypothetical protein DL93DRAFT_1507482 [Clavulina sp. PMI_390]|nr:hypothetical protein DL93DRAFT_1507482 [Clavulina sp. PMI_390]